MGLLKDYRRLLTSIGNASKHTKCASLNNQQCMIQPTLINLHSNEYSHGLRYCPFVVNLDKCIGKYNTQYDLLNRVCVPNKTEDLNLCVLTWLQKRMNRKN